MSIKLNQKERNDIFDSMNKETLIKIIRLEILKTKKKLKEEIFKSNLDKIDKHPELGYSKLVEYIENTLNIILPTKYNELDEYSNYILRFRYEERYPYHDGYCSDPGEDIGEIEESEEIIKLTKRQLIILEKEKIDLNKDIPYYIVNKLGLFIGEEDIPCCNGSGYCGYTGYKEYISGKIEIDRNKNNTKIK